MSEAETVNLGGECGYCGLLSPVHRASCPLAKVVLAGNANKSNNQFVEVKVPGKINWPSAAQIAQCLKPMSDYLNGRLSTVNDEPEGASDETPKPTGTGGTGEGECMKIMEYTCGHRFPQAGPSDLAPAYCEKHCVDGRIVFGPNMWAVFDCGHHVDVAATQVSRPECLNQGCLGRLKGFTLHDPNDYKPPEHRKSSSEKPATMADLYPKYYKDVSKLDSVDVYRVHRLFGVTDNELHHASKKILLCGVRTGGKSARKEIEEARDTLNRWLEIQDEDAAG